MDLGTLFLAYGVAFILIGVLTWSLVRVARRADDERDRHVREHARQAAAARRSGRFERQRAVDRGRAQRAAEEAAASRR